jgi:hypothetical protein
VCLSIGNPFGLGQILGHHELEEFSYTLCDFITHHCSLKLPTDLRELFGKDSKHICHNARHARVIHHDAVLVNVKDSIMIEVVLLVEFCIMVDDPSVPGVMAYVLRVFSKKLTQIGGQLKGAVMRDEVAECVTEFFQLMMAKNLTKTKWVSNALTNGSLPIQFSAAVFKQLVEQDKAPDKLTNLPVGRDITGFMVQMAPDYVGKIMQEAADPGYWHRQGYPKKDQAPTIKTLKGWIEWSEKKYKENVSLDGLQVSFLSNEDREEIASSEGYQALKKEMASLTDEEMNTRISAFHRDLRHEHLRHQKAIFHSDATRVLFRHLLGDVTGGNQSHQLMFSQSQRVVRWLSL